MSRPQRWWPWRGHCLAVASLVTAAAAQPPAVVPSAVPYGVQAWTIRDGLPQNEVTALHQTRDGRLWITTYGGLARFDGLRFEIFDVTSHPGLRSNRIRTLHETRDGALWIGVESRGLARLHDGEFTYYDEAAGLPDAEVRCLFEDTAHRLWVGTDQGLSWVAGDRIIQLEGVAGPVSGLAESPAGALWIAAGDQLMQRRGAAVTTVRRGGSYRSVTAAADGSVWVGTAERHVERWRGGELQVLELPLGHDVRAITEDRDGGIWFGSLGPPVRWFEGGFEDPFGSHGYPLATPARTNAALADREGNLWFGGSWGLCRLRPTPFTGVPLPAGAGADTPRAVAADAAGRLWVATQGGVLLRLEHGVLTDFTLDSGVAANSLALGRDGSLWAASSRGLWRIENDGTTPAALDLDLPPGVRWALAEDRHGNLWIGCGEAVYRRRPDGLDVWTPATGLAGGPVVAILASSRDELWVGSDNGLCRIAKDAGVTTWFSGRRLPAGAVRGLYEDPGGNIWAGTYGGGICRVSHDGEVRSISTSEGLYEGVVSRIVDAGHGQLLLQGNRALSLVSLQELAEAADGTRQRVFPRVFESGPGIEIFEGMGGATPLSCQAPDGALWFPALEGLVRFDPAALTPVETPPHPLIEAVLVDGRELTGRGPWRVPPGDRHVEFRFAAASLVDAAQSRVRYRLRGHRDAWSEAGSRRSVEYLRLPPGNYRFEVAAANRDGVWSTRAASVTLELQPWFYETVWFAPAAVLLSIALALGAVLFRTRGVRRRAQHLETLVGVRTRELQGEIADRRRAEDALRDAHDHLEEEVSQRTAQLADALESVRNAAARREALELQLRESQKFEAVGRLAGGMAHDLNNILTAILVESDLVLDSLNGRGADHDERREGLRAIKDAGERSAQLTRQLLAYSRQQFLQPEVIDPNDTIDELRKMLRRLVAEDIELAVRLAPDVGFVYVDPSQLGQVIVNLVVNASDATAGGGRITILTSAARSDDVDAEAHPDGSAARHIRIDVTDTGTGIDEEIRDHIFEPFFSTKKPGKGTGLGLASVHGIVKQSGGRIRVSSTPGVGTTFSVYLPAVDAAPASNTAAASIEYSAADATVLLCDDEAQIRQVASRLLVSKGYRVLTAESPTHALQLAGAHPEPIDLLVTDVVMPEMHGTELAARLRASRSDLRVLYISGYSPDQFVAKEVMDAVTQFLHKPFDSETLVRRVAEILAAPTSAV